MIKNAAVKVLLFVIDTPFQYVVLVGIAAGLGFFFDWLEVYVNSRP